VVEIRIILSMLGRYDVGFSSGFDCGCGGCGAGDRSDDAGNAPRIESRFKLKFKGVVGCFFIVSQVR
jgi:hypothetical protein